MRIRLIYPPAAIRLNPIAPLGISTLKSSLIQAGYNCDISDLQLECWLHNQEHERKINLQNITDIDQANLFLDGKNNKIKEDVNLLIDIGLKQINKYQAVGFSIMGSDQLPSSLLLAEKIKKLTNAVIIFGGYFASAFAKEILSNYLFVDFVLAGNSWITFPKLIDCIEHKKQISSIPGLAYRNGLKIAISLPLPSLIESMPIPDFSGLPVQVYAKRAKAAYRLDTELLILQYLISEGCVNKCAFCRRTFAKLQLKTPQKIVHEIKTLVLKHNTRYFKFETNEINPTEEYLIELCDEILREKLTIYWHAYARLEKLSKKTLEKLYLAGCRMLRFGVETGSQRLLDKFNKGYTIREMERILKNSHEAGIWNAVYLLSGLPGETEADVQDTLTFIENNHCNINAAAINIFFLLRGTDVFLDPSKYGIEMINSNEQEIAFNEIGGLNWEEKQEFVRRSVETLQNAFLMHNIGFSAVSTDLMFSALLTNKNLYKTNKWIATRHPYLYSKAPLHVLRWKIYHPGEDFPEGFEDAYFEKRLGGTVLYSREIQ